jgi:hypothetical protein
MTKTGLVESGAITIRVSGITYSAEEGEAARATSRCG